MAAPRLWTALVLTSTRPDVTQVYLREFRRRQKEGLLHADTWIISVEDPPSTIGSGGATVNALMVATEYLSARQGHTVISADSLSDAHILILHLGGTFPCDPCGKPLVTFAATEKNKTSALTTQADHLLQAIGQLAAGAQPGVWVCSTEMVLSLPTSFSVPWSTLEAVGGVSVVTVPGPLEHASGHGVYHLSDDGKAVNALLYRAPDADIQAARLADGSCPLVSGIVRLSTAVAVRLLELHDRPPLDACTYFGLDNGAEPLQLSLFLDIIAAMLPGNSDFVAQGRDDLHRRARKELAASLAGTRVTPIVVTGGAYVYMPAKFSQHMGLLHAGSPLRLADERTEEKARTWARLTHTIGAGSVPASAVVINAALSPAASIGAGSVVCHSTLQHGHIVIGSECFVSGVELQQGQRLALGDGLVLMQVRVREGDTRKQGHKIWVTLGIHDTLSAAGLDPASGPHGMLFNAPFESFFERTGITAQDLWEPGQAMCAGTAKLFALAHLEGEPSLEDVEWLVNAKDAASVRGAMSRWRRAWRVSLSDLMAVSDLAAELEWRQTVYTTIGEANLKAALCMAASVSMEALQAQLPGEPNQCISPFLEFCAVTGRFSVLEALDDVAANTDSFGVAARALASIADVLGAYARGRGGLRSGPGRNESFQAAFECLEQRELARGVRLLATERARWLGSPESLVRAARHYEAAAQILIRQAVSTAREFVKTAHGALPPLGQWAIAESPARIDLAGGWSDTPPLTYEHGGVVVNASVSIDGQRPMGAKCRRVVDPVLVLVLGGVTEQRIVLTELDQLRSYTQPQSPGALLKAAFCCAGLVSLADPRTLATQLLEKYTGGFELHTWSNLPHGSGLGTSSILAGAIMASIWSAAGVTFDTAALNHAVLHLEQMLTTGGGWQDQVGGLVGGVKLTRSPGTLPLSIHVEHVTAPAGFVEKFADHLVLIYTGKTRLARNLLQNVVRNWYARSPAIVANVDALTANAEACAAAFADGDLAAIGDTINKYWEQKKIMAPGCEPAFVRRMMDIFEPHAYGQTLVGAGGGGFMYVVTKEPNASDVLQRLIRDEPELQGVRFHEVTVDNAGLVLSAEE